MKPSPHGVEQFQFRREARQFDDLHAGLVEYFEAADGYRGRPAHRPVGDLDATVESLVDLAEDDRATGAGAGERRQEDDEEAEEEEEREQNPGPAAAALFLC